MFFFIKKAKNCCLFVVNEIYQMVLKRISLADFKRVGLLFKTNLFI